MKGDSAVFTFSEKYPKNLSIFLIDFKYFETLCGGTITPNLLEEDFKVSLQRQKQDFVLGNMNRILIFLKH